MLKIFQVDSFTGVPFGGNPAGVCVLEKEIEERQYLNIAAEMNLSETAFVNPLTKSNTFGLRWFTPKTEVKMCGHATLATAWVQFTELGIEGEIFYETLSGRLKVRYVDGKIEMDFPSDNPVRVPIDDALESIIGAKGKGYYSPATEKLIYFIPSISELEAILPDFNLLEKMDFGIEVKGLIVTSPGDQRYDFYSRYFAPWVGINEDPVTGSAHTVLGPFWSNQLGKRVLKACQLSSRMGEIELRLLEENRILILGEAVTLIRGTISI
ncbi:phenazine biosynthesis protein PhzF family protein [Mesotoga sp. SC_4PWA21]|nr:phenazine biosynthesis protein PhzF family protein [Mesotoga sp. SC_4PWA21]